MKDAVDEEIPAMTTWFRMNDFLILTIPTAFGVWTNFT